MSEDSSTTPSSTRRLSPKGEGLGRSDLDEARRSAEDEHRGLTRRDLLVRGGVGAAAVGGLGALAGTGGGQDGGERQVHGHAPRSHARRRVPDPGHREAGLQGPRASPSSRSSRRQRSSRRSRSPRRTPSTSSAATTTSRSRCGPRAACSRSTPTGSRTGDPSTSCSRTGSSTRPRRAAPSGRGMRRFGRRSSTRTAPPGSAAYAQGPPSNKQIVRWIGENGKPIGGKPQPRWIVGPAAHFNADSMGYNADVIKKRPDQVSWAELLNTKWKGRVALLDDPGIVTQDARHAAQALGHPQDQGLGNMTKAEIDRLFKILTKYKKNGPVPRVLGDLQRLGQPHGLEGGRDRVDVVARRGAVKARRREHPLRRPAGGLPRLVRRRGHLVEGHGDPAKLQACYDYINWKYNGYLGADDHAPGLLHRQRADAAPVDQVGRGQAGRRSRPTSTTTGGAARRRRATCPGITGKVGDIKKGSTREGGIVPAAHLQLLVVELLLRRTTCTRSSGGTTSSAPSELDGGRGSSTDTEGAAAAAPSASVRVRARPDRADEGLPRRHGRRRRRQPARRPRRVRRPARAVGLRQDDDAADDRRPRVPDRGRHPARRPVARRPAAAQAADDDGLPALRPVPAPVGARRTSSSG